MVIKRAAAHVKRTWSERDRDTSTSWQIFGIAMLVTVVALAWYVALPALCIMVAAWAIHQVWESFPAISYWTSVACLIGFYIAGQAAGFLLRALILGITRGMR